MRARSLHVAALPFPSPQGTQAAIAAMLNSLSDAGHDAHLLTYAHGDGKSEIRFTHHRINGPSLTHSLRSGPSLAKLGLDALLAKRTRALIDSLSPDLVIAHHVEAAIACAGLAKPTAFIAHTSVELELSSYFPRAVADTASSFGYAIDSLALRAHQARAAIAPSLCEHLRARHQTSVRYVPLPWPLATPVDEAPSESRARYGLASDAEVIAYLGNLDRYQGIEQLIEAFATVSRQREGAHLLIASASAHTELTEKLIPPSLRRRVTLVALGDELVRQRLHALADVIAVPRAIAGGVPVKLLDACARAKSIVTVERAIAGLPVQNACVVCRNDDTAGFAAALVEVLSRPDRRRAQARNALAYVEREHNAPAFLSAFEALCDDALHQGIPAA